MAYSNRVMARFMQPTFQGELAPQAQHRYLQAQVGSLDQGAVLQLSVLVDEQTHCIDAARFKMYGCGACIATADVLCEQLIGLTQQALGDYSAQGIAEYLALPPVKLHCTWLAEEAIQQILMAWQSASLTH